MLIEELKILARGAFVLDKNGKVVYAEQVKEVAEEPNYAGRHDGASRDSVVNEPVGRSSRVPIADPDRLCSAGAIASLGQRSGNVLAGGVEGLGQLFGMLAAGLGHVGLAAAASADDFGGARESTRRRSARAAPGRG